MTTPRYSVLLPTRNGGELLRGCIASVLAEQRDDIQLVVSDNASDQETADVIDAFRDDPRLVAVRQTSPVGVTENWSACLREATGERVSLLGDDDRLLPGFFEHADGLLRDAGDVDVLHANGYGYAFPGFAGGDTSHYADPFFLNDVGIPRDETLDARTRRWIVDEVLEFRFPLHLNMQTVLVRRAALHALPRGAFRDPFPDFYALLALLLTSSSFVVSDAKLAVIGVSAKSFGRTVHDPQQQDAGLAYLGIRPVFPGRLPGSEILNGTHQTVDLLVADFPDALRGASASRAAYVAGQIYSWYQQVRLGAIDRAELLRRARLLSPRDLRLFGGLAAKRVRPAVLRDRLRVRQEHAVTDVWPGMRPCPEVASIDEFARWITEQEDRTSGARPVGGPQAPA